MAEADVLMGHDHFVTPNDNNNVITDEEDLNSEDDIEEVKRTKPVVHLVCNMDGSNGIMVNGDGIVDIINKNDNVETNKAAVINENQGSDVVNDTKNDDNENVNEIAWWSTRKNRGIRGLMPCDDFLHSVITENN